MPKAVHGKIGCCATVLAPEEVSSGMAAVEKFPGAERDRRGTHGGYSDYFESGHVRTHDHEEPSGYGCWAKADEERERGSGCDGHSTSPMTDIDYELSIVAALLLGDARVLQKRQQLRSATMYQNGF